MSASKSDHDTLWELIKGIKFGMLTHRNANGMLHAHPLTTQNESLDAESHLYFFISRKSELAQSLLQDGNVNVSYADPGEDSYVSVSGQAVIAEDPEKRKRSGRPWHAPGFQQACKTRTWPCWKCASTTPNIGT